MLVASVISDVGAFAALLLAVVTVTKVVSPVTLLIVIFALSAVDAFEWPSWRATLPELVGKDDLPAASALNGIEFNFARSITIPASPGPTGRDILIGRNSVLGMSAADVPFFGGCD
jgi:hypothetical protein